MDRERGARSPDDARPHLFIVDSKMIYTSVVLSGSLHGSMFFMSIVTAIVLWVWPIVLAEDAIPGRSSVSMGSYRAFYLPIFFILNIFRGRFSVYAFLQTKNIGGLECKY
ncbi:MAG: hypothetical protein IMX04_00810 [Candidatus Carbobacillus altaicus]|nr:hypothetical protein [Candidatus Carbobacillus altaicus]